MLQDLQCLGRDLGQTIIVDNSPHSYMFQPENALPIGTFIDDMQDQVGARPPPALCSCLPATCLLDGHMLVGGWLAAAQLPGVVLCAVGEGTV